MKRTALAILIAAFGASAAADTHLEIHRNFGAWDDEPVAHVVFARAYAPDILARMRVSYAFGGPVDALVALREDNGRYDIVDMQVDTLLVLYAPGPKRDFGRPHPANYRDLRTAQCQAPLEAGLAHRIAAAWQMVLAHGRPEVQQRGLDGANYRFWSRQNNMSGFVWSPDDGTEPGMLVAVADAMRELCGKPDRINRAALEDSVRALEVRLKGKKK